MLGIGELLAKNNFSEITVLFSASELSVSSKVTLCCPGDIVLTISLALLPTKPSSMYHLNCLMYPSSSYDCRASNLISEPAATFSGNVHTITGGALTLTVFVFITVLHEVVELVLNSSVTKYSPGVVKV